MNEIMFIIIFFFSIFDEECKILKIECVDFNLFHMQ